VIAAALALCGPGCHTVRPVHSPTEISKVAHPEYTIAPPDILLIDAVNLVPRPPYRIAPLDGLLIQVAVLAPKYRPNELREGQPIDGLYRVEVDGRLNLGFSYGVVQVAGMTIDQARDVIAKHLQDQFNLKFALNVALAESRALQQIRGEHLVRQDGKVTLGIYGSVFVAGLTTDEARQAIEAHLSRFLFQPEVSVDVSGYNSKVFYVIIDLDGAGQQVTRFPVTGNETVLDAISEIRGLPAGTDRRRIWVARRSQGGKDCREILPVDWDAVACGGETDTNYQLMPGDRVYVSVDRCVALDQWLAKVLSPVERVLGITLLGTSVVENFQTISRSTNSTTITTTSVGR
jgi:polysaccharide export outer membrane protein